MAGPATGPLRWRSEPRIGRRGQLRLCAPGRGAAGRALPGSRSRGVGARARGSPGRGGARSPAVRADAAQARRSGIRAPGARGSLGILTDIAIVESELSVVPLYEGASHSGGLLDALADAGFGSSPWSRSCATGAPASTCSSTAPSSGASRALGREAPDRACRVGRRTARSLGLRPGRLDDLPQAHLERVAGELLRVCGDAPGDRSG